MLAIIQLLNQNLKLTVIRVPVVPFRFYHNINQSQSWRETPLQNAILCCPYPCCPRSNLPLAPFQCPRYCSLPVIIISFPHYAQLNFYLLLLTSSLRFSIFDTSSNSLLMIQSVLQAYLKYLSKASVLEDINFISSLLFIWLMLLVLQIFLNLIIPLWLGLHCRGCLVHLHLPCKLQFPGTQICQHPLSPAHLLPLHHLFEDLFIFLARLPLLGQGYP